jgi:hypothetical protein
LRYSDYEVPIYQNSPKDPPLDPVLKATPKKLPPLDMDQEAPTLAVFLDQEVSSLLIRSFELNAFS